MRNLSKERPFIPPSPDRTRWLNPTSPLDMGRIYGVRMGIRMGLLYALLMALLFIVAGSITQIGTMTVRPDFGTMVEAIGDSYRIAGGMALVLLGMGIVAAVPMGAIVGVLGGALIGLSYLPFSRRLSHRQALLWGAVRSLVVTALFAPFMWGVLTTFMGEEPLLLGVLWVLPVGLAFADFWWVAYKVNQKLTAFQA
jgi:hypothetical protein